MRRRGGATETLILGSFGALIVFGCVLRFWRLAELGFWYDELWAVVGATGRPLSSVYREWMLGDSHPPGFFLANFLWFHVAPATEFWARIPHAIASVVTVLFLLTGAARVLTRDERIMAAALFSLCSLSIHYAHEVKQYSWVLLLATILTITCLEIVVNRVVNRRSGLLLGLTAVGLAYLDYFAMAYAALVLLTLTLVLFREPHAWPSMFRVDLAVGLFCLPLVPFVYYQVAYAPGGWQWPDVSEFLPVLAESLFFDDRVWVWGGLGLVAISIAVAAAVRPHVRAMFGSRREVHLLALWGCTTGFILALGLWQPVLFPRYFLITFPAFFLLIGIALARLVPPGAHWLAVVPLVFFLRAAVVQVETVAAMRRQEWDKSVDLVLDRMRPGDRVFVLGARADKTSFDYLKEGNVDGVFYVKNISFYEYYFERRGAADVAAQLEVVEPTVRAAEGLVRRFRGSGTTVFVLAGHHISFHAGVSAVLAGATTKVETIELFGTLVYALTF